MAAGHGHPVADDGWGKMRAADADRDRVAGILGTAYSEGRLSKDEYDARLDSALSARTFADLDRLLTDLPVARATAAVVATETGTVTPLATTNRMAIASLVCGLAQFMFGPLGTIPAIVFGHMARNQIRRTGERGTSLALAGLVLGWGVLILGIFVFIAVALPAAGGMQGTMPVHMG